MTRVDLYRLAVEPSAAGWLGSPAAPNHREFSTGARGECRAITYLPELEIVAVELHSDPVLLIPLGRVIYMQPDRREDVAVLLDGVEL